MSTLQLHPQPKTHKIQNIRAKLSSLKSLSLKNRDDLGLLALQKSFDKYNTIDDPQTTVEEFKTKEEDDIVIEDKLWTYFKSKADEMDKNTNRTEKEKVNGWHKLVKTILTEIDKKIKINESHAEQMEILIKNKYKESHIMFKEIESIKLAESLQKRGKTGKLNQSKSRRNEIETSRRERINTIQENIESLKDQINERTQQNQYINMELLKMKEERKSLLVNLLKNGYYFNEGVKQIFEKMIEICYKPTLKDFPSFLDDKSKKFLLREYDEIIKKKKQSKQEEEIAYSLTNRPRSKSNVQLSKLIKQENMRDIYNGTKDYLLKLLSKRQWKSDESTSSIIFPKIRSKHYDGEMQKRREQERRRIKTAYLDQVRDKVKKIQFGIRVETILS